MKTGSFASSDTLTVGMGSGQASFQVTVDLANGACSGRSQRSVGKRVRADVAAALTEEELAVVRAGALELHARADFEYRDQFAQAGVSFVVVLDGVRVSADYHLDGGRTDFEHVYDIVAHYAWQAAT